MARERLEWVMVYVVIPERVVREGVEKSEEGGTATAALVVIKLISYPEKRGDFKRYVSPIK